MKTIRNLTQKPLRIPLGGGKVLHLGPGHRGQIAEGNLERPAFRRMVDSGQVEILDAGPASHGPTRGGAGEHESTQGRPPAKTPHPTGDR